MYVFNNTENLSIARNFKNELASKIFGVQAYFLSTKAKKNIILPPKNHNIIGFGYGVKVTNGVVQKQLCVRVYVRKKLLNIDLQSEIKVPSEVNGLPTDVIELGEIYATQRSIKRGESISHYRVSAGTLGCVVQCRIDRDKRYILSNNHVLADINKATKGDKIIQPSLSDGGNMNNPIAYLEDFNPIKFGDDEENIMDAAIARILTPTEIDTGITGFGYVPESTMLARANQYVYKHGRTTGYTTGIIEGLSEDIGVYYDGRIAQFVDQLTIIGDNTTFSRSGDSGSLIVDVETQQPVALVFAGENRYPWRTFANPISPILKHFNVTVLGQMECRKRRSLFLK